MGGGDILSGAKVCRRLVWIITLCSAFSAAAEPATTDTAVSLRVNSLWSNPTVCKGNDLFAPAVPVTPCAAPGNSCIVAACMDSTIALLSATDGSVLWRADAGAPSRGTPSHHGGVIVVTNTQGTVMGLDASTGVAKWQWRCPKAGFVFSTTVDANAGVVAVASRECPTVVLSLRSGKPLCHLATTDGVWGPAYFSTSEGVFAAAMTASCLVVAAVDPNLSATCADRAETTSSSDANFGTAVMPSYRVDIAPTIGGKGKLRYWIFSGPVATPDGFLITGANDGALHGLAKSTGRIEFMIDVPRSGPISAPLVPSVDRTTLWGAGEQGVLFSARRSPENNTWHRDVLCAYESTTSKGNIVVVAREEYLFGAFHSPSGGSFIARCRSANAGIASRPVVVSRLPLGCEVRSLGCVGCELHARGALDITLIAGCKNGTWVAIRFFDDTPTTPPPRSPESDEVQNAAAGGANAWSQVWTGRFNDVALAVLAFLTLYSVAWRRAVLRARAARQLGTVP